MYAIMRYADFILLPDHRLQHPRSEAIACVGCPDYLGFLFIMGLSGATNFFTQDRLQTGFSVLLDDLLNSALRHFDIQRNLFCAYLLAVLTKDIADLRLVQFHILDYVSKLRLEAK